MNSDVIFDSTPRNDNGVKVRLDGKGDPWANAHRDLLEKKYFLHDLDAVCGIVAFAHNTGERLFLEYVPDDYRNRPKTIRKFAIVALFDRKSTESHAFSGESLLGRGLYLHLCRILAAIQQAGPRFFYVIGGKVPPWRMIELDINTGERIGEISTVDGQSQTWRTVWNRIGLSQLRQQLVTWIQP